jgi:hypothetical protein
MNILKKIYGSTNKDVINKKMEDFIFLCYIYCFFKEMDEEEEKENLKKQCEENNLLDNENSRNVVVKKESSEEEDEFSDSGSGFVH